MASGGTQSTTARAAPGGEAPTGAADGNRRGTTTGDTSGGGSSTRYVVTQLTKRRRKFSFGLPRSSAAAEDRQPDDERTHGRRRVLGGRRRSGKKSARQRLPPSANAALGGASTARPPSSDHDDDDDDDDSTGSSVSVSSRTISDVERALEIVDQHARQLGLSRQQMMECLEQEDTANAAAQQRRRDDDDDDDGDGDGDGNEGRDESGGGRSLDEFTLHTLEDLESLTTAGDRNAQNTVGGDTAGVESVQNLVGKLEKALPMQSGNASVGSVRTAVEIKEFLNILDRHADYFGVSRDEMIQRLDEEQAVLMVQPSGDQEHGPPAERDAGGPSRRGRNNRSSIDNILYEEEEERDCSPAPPGYDAIAQNESFARTECSHEEEEDRDGKVHFSMTTENDRGDHDLDGGCRAVGFQDPPKHDESAPIDDDDPGCFADYFRCGNNDDSADQLVAPPVGSTVLREQKPRPGAFADDGCGAPFGRCGAGGAEEEEEADRDGPMPAERFRRKYYKSRARAANRRARHNSPADVSDAPDEIRIRGGGGGQQSATTKNDEERKKSVWMDTMMNTLELNETEEDSVADSVSTMTGMSSGADMGGGRAKSMYGARRRHAQNQNRGGSSPVKSTRGGRMLSWRKGKHPKTKRRERS